VKDEIKLQKNTESSRRKKQWSRHHVARVSKTERNKESLEIRGVSLTESIFTQW
jgi:hypothetical protein